MSNSVAVLGSTGSIGTTALSGLKKLYPGVRVDALCCGANIEKMLSQAVEHKCRFIASAFIDSAFAAKALAYGIRTFSSVDELLKATDATLVINGISGTAGIHASFRALDNGKDLALANKESIVCAGELILSLAKKKGLKVIPVDSEHSAVYELLCAFGSDSLSKIVITASGGPFFRTPEEELSSISPERAAAHPTWKMGQKISIDSATLANKALEVIEAGKLFSCKSSDIRVVIHPQSIVHSMINLKNGQTYAQLSIPTMEFPIMNSVFRAFGLPYSQPLSKPLFETMENPLDFHFEAPDFKRFPLLKAGFNCLESGGSLPLCFTVADEVAVKAFVEGRIPFTGIGPVVEKVLCKWNGNEASCENDVTGLLEKARLVAEAAL